MVIVIRVLENTTGDKKQRELVWHKCYVEKLEGDSNRELENTTGDNKKQLGLVRHQCYVTKLAGDSRALENSTGDCKK